MSLRSRWGFGSGSRGSGSGNPLAGLSTSVTAAPRRAAKSGWEALFSLPVLILAGIGFLIWKVEDGTVQAWLGNLIQALLHLIPTLAIVMALLLVCAVLIAAGMWAVFHGQHLGQHGFHMGWKAAVGVVLCAGSLPVLLFAVDKTTQNMAALQHSYLGQAPASSLCAVQPASPQSPTGAIVGPTPRQP